MAPPMLSQNLGPLWKIVCCMDVGVEMPSDAVSKILEEQVDWERKRERRSQKEYLHKQYRTL